MSTDLQRPSLDAILNDALKRIASLEQRFTAPSVVKAAFGNQFDTIVLGPTGNQVTLQKPTSPPTGLSLASSSFYDVIYVNVSWTAPVDASATEYSVEWAKKLGPSSYDIPSAMRSSGTSARIQPLEPNTTYGVRVYGVNNVGVYSTPLPSSGYTDITTGVDSTIPPAVTGVTIGRGATTAVITFTPLTAVQAPDVANGAGAYRVQLSTSNTFTTIFRESTSGDFVVAFNDITGPGSYYARVAAIDSSGNQGTWSSVAGPATVGGVNDSMIVADLDAAKITAGFLVAARIQANSLVVEKLQTSQLQTVDITLAGGSLKAGTPGTGSGNTGLLINSQGIRLYNNGVLVITLDALTGSGTFSGTITGSTITGGSVNGATVTGGVVRTASSGKRVEMNSSVTEQIRFFTGEALEITPAEITGIGGSGGGYLGIYSPELSSAAGDQAYVNLYAGSAGGPSAVSIGGSDTISLVTAQTNLQGDLYVNGVVTGGLYMGSDMLVQGYRLRLQGYANYDEIFYTNAGYGTYIAGTQPITGPFIDSTDSVGIGSLGGLALKVRYYDVNCFTSFFCGDKHFKIDHPLDDSKHLIFSTTEGPRADLLYRGQAYIVRGHAEVDLDDHYGMTPGTFEALTRHSESELFLFNPEGDALPKGKVAGSKVLIECDTRAATVSWMVIAERKDEHIKRALVTSEDGRLVNEHPKTQEELDARTATPQPIRAESRRAHDDSGPSLDEAASDVRRAGSYRGNAASDRRAAPGGKSRAAKNH